MQIGNGRWETASYNNRLQITQIGLGKLDTNQDLLKLEYSYGTNTQNNGSLREQKITVPTVGQTAGFTAVQTYTYDDLNRLQSATEMISSQTWRQTFQYDRYGNRRFDAANTTTLGSCSQAVCNPLINTSDNRFSSGQGYLYDKTGNVTNDANSQQYFYDAENHQKEVKNASGVTVGTYLYDGEGKRVKKITNTETTVFVYNAAGQLVAEYSTTVAPVSEAQVSYLTQDHLGSPRIITDRDGKVISRKDYSAFGEATMTAQRSANPEYAGQGELTRKDYTGYEKDGESGLEFAQARYYNSSHGRFTSVDPLTASGTIKNPQTLNRYSYALNSPYKFTDPLGLLPQGASSWGFCGAQYSSCSGEVSGGFGNPVFSENEPVVVDLNIVYNSSQMSEAGARESMRETIRDLQNTFGAINIQFNITFQAGTADMSSQDNEECPNCAYNITSGAVDGAINVFLHDNTKNLQQNVSYFRTQNSQIFIEKVGGRSLGQKLAHEVGHLFRFFVNGEPPSGIPLPADTGTGWRLVGSGNHSEDSIINDANDKMRRGGLKYGVDYVDDYTTTSPKQILVPQLGWKKIPYQPSALDIYPLGARRVAAQRR